MGRGLNMRRIERMALAAVGCGLLSACGGSAGFEPQRESTYSLSSLGNLIAFNKLFPGSAPLPQSEAPIECPVVEVQDGTASVRVFKGAEQTNDTVRYGFSLGDVARECSKTGDLIQLKVGVEGRVLVGPAGTPGTFTVPVRIAVRNDNTQAVLASKLSTISATVPADGTQAAFSYVSEPFTVPFVAHPDEDYTILVGFDPNGRGATPVASTRRKKPRQ